MGSLGMAMSIGEIGPATEPVARDHRRSDGPYHRPIPMLRIRRRGPAEVSIQAGRHLPTRRTLRALLQAAPRLLTPGLQVPRLPVRTHLAIPPTRRLLVSLSWARRLQAILLYMAHQVRPNHQTHRLRPLLVLQGHMTQRAHPLRQIPQLHQLQPSLHVYPILHLPGFPAMAAFSSL